MKVNFLPKAAGALAVAGLVAGTAGAQTTFQVTATVQNALTVTNAANMNLGTLFATSANSTAYRWVTLAPNGDWGTVQGDTTGVTLITLGGQSAARGSVTVGGNTTPFTVTLPTASLATGAGTQSTALGASGAGANSWAAGQLTILGAAPVVRVADPGVARFYLVNFVAGAVSGGNTSSNCNTATCTITPTFGASDVSFGIGATVVTEYDSGARPSYAAATYTGSFNVSAAY